MRTNIADFCVVIYLSSVSGIYLLMCSPVMYFQSKESLGLPNYRHWSVPNIFSKMCQQPDFNIFMGYDRDHRQRCCSTGM